jgi:hypothetical protein
VSFISQILDSIQSLGYHLGESKTLRRKVEATQISGLDLFRDANLAPDSVVDNSNWAGTCEFCYVHLSHSYRAQEIFIVGGPLRVEVYRNVFPNTTNRNSWGCYKCMLQVGSGAVPAIRLNDKRINLRMYHSVLVL